ncbi:MAG: hypothetical protein E6K59_06555 [Nitrospirae bacterium]|nr:MAG: hypothetical protein E6K59_06555 [Nitrospirota bacterium]
MPQLALVLTTVIWAATFPATKRVLEQVLPLSFLFQRFLVSSLVLAPSACATPRPRTRPSSPRCTSYSSPSSCAGLTSGSGRPSPSP